MPLHIIAQNTHIYIYVHIHIHRHLHVIRYLMCHWSLKHWETVTNLSTYSNSSLVNSLSCHDAAPTKKLKNSSRNQKKKNVPKLLNAKPNHHHYYYCSYRSYCSCTATVKEAKWPLCRRSRTSHDASPGGGCRQRRINPRFLREVVDMEHDGYHEASDGHTLARPVYKTQPIMIMI